MHFAGRVTAYLVLVTLPITCGCHGDRAYWHLPKQQYVDKCKGAWAGQMIGVCYGAPYEFKYMARTMEDPIEPWRPERIEGAIGQDDCYVEMTWLAALEKHGLDITFEQAGRAFADTKYGLAHANKFGRENVRKGIMPPLSGDPKYNRHADDIDFQIEADLLGIICPGMPQESNRLCDVFGHVMNYGDGVYGGMFVAGMYAAAYFESEDVGHVVRAGLACIPRESLYHKCIADVIRWHAEHPDDWRATWRKIEEKWQDDIDCWPGHPFNIDARLNGAYIAVGLLYGDGDFMKTLEIATRCGQDNDCNPSNAAGVLGCMKGFAALGEDLTGGIARIEDTHFAHTDYSFKTLIPACQRMTERIVQRVGGEVLEDAYFFPVQSPRPPAKLEQWEDQMPALVLVVPEEQVKAWDPAWKVTACGNILGPGFKASELGRENVMKLHPVNNDWPAVMTARLEVPAEGKPTLVIPVASHKEGDFVLEVFVNDKLVREVLIDTQGKWITERVDLADLAGKRVAVRVEAHSNDWHWEAAYFGRIEIRQ